MTFDLHRQNVNAAPDRRFPPNARPTRELLKYVPQLSTGERDRRWRNLRKRMLFAGIDVLIFIGNDVFWDTGMANMRYMFQVGAKQHGWAMFPIEGEPIVWHSIPHINRPFNPHLTNSEWLKDYRPFPGIAGVAEELRAGGFEKSRIGLVGFSSTLVPPSITHSDFIGMQKALPLAEITDVSWMLQELRLVKSEEEIDMLRKGGKIARKVIDTMLEFARPGVTEAQLWAEMLKTQIINGAEPDAFNLLNSGPLEHPEDELWHLLHGTEQPLVPTLRPLSKGDIIISEYHTKYGGYVCHTEYTVYMGKAPQELKDIWSVCIESLDISREVMVPGKSFREAWEAIRKPCERAGYDYVELGWHGMGSASPEFPTVIYRPGYGPNVLNGHLIGDMEFEEGMTFGNNLDIHNPAWKLDVGCVLSDFMVVRPGGAELLIDVPREIGEVY